MVEIRFKPSLVGSVADGAITEIKLANGAVTNIKVNTGAAIAKTKLEALAIGDSDVQAISVGKITDAVAGSGTTGDKAITKIGWDSVTEEVVIDHAA